MSTKYCARCGVDPGPEAHALPLPMGNRLPVCDRCWSDVFLPQADYRARRTFAILRQEPTDEQLEAAVASELEFIARGLLSRTRPGDAAADN